MAEPQTIESAPKDERVLLFVPAFGPWIGSWWPGSWSWAREQWTIHTPFGHDKAVFAVDIPQPTHWLPMPPTPGAGVCLTCAANHYCPEHNPVPSGVQGLSVTDDLEQQEVPSEPVAFESATVEAIAREWDGCMAPMFDPAGNATAPIDIGATIREAFAASPSTTEKPVRSEMLRQCAASGQMDSAQIHAHEVAGELGDAAAAGVNVCDGGRQ